MTPDERNLINGLFERLRSADANAPAKDQEAEALIRQLTAQNPSAGYLLTQTILVQEHALSNAQTRIQTLERQVAQAQQPSSSKPHSGGFLSNFFGGSSAPTPPPQPQQTLPPVPPQPPAPPYPSTVNMAPSAGGGFLRNALTTAAGVAGGAILFQGIENLLGHNSGPFGSGLGGGFLGGGARPEITQDREIVNNYYNSDGPGGEHQGGGAGGGDYDSGGIPQGAADQPAHPGYEDARFDDSKFDSGNPFDKPTDDSSFLNSTDNSSLDNNFDLGNTDAGSSSSDFGGGDFAGGDNSGSDDSGNA